MALSFGVAWPILELLGRNPAFFAARDASAAEVWGFAVVLAVGIPAFGGLLATLPGPVGRMAYTALVGFGAFSLTARALRQSGVEHLLVWGIACVVVSVSVIWLLESTTGARAVTRLMVVVPVVFVFLFIFTTASGASVRGDSAGMATPLTVDRPVPILLIVFDEFPTSSILDENGELRRDWYPNFGRLLDDGTWYRNAATVEQQTDHAVPAILTGSVPSQQQFPILRDYPGSLFTWLRRDYAITSLESMTSLCPSSCNSIRQQTLASRRFSGLVRDATVATAHGLLPSALRGRLPPIEDAWGNFAQMRVVDEWDDNTDSLVTTFGASIDSSDPASTLYFMHVSLPHRPWAHLPNGDIVDELDDAPPGFVDGGWTDPWAADVSIQRHLMEARYADTVLGGILDRLDALGLYDDTLIVAVADHGAAIHEGNMRVIRPDAMGDIGQVPLFVKQPDQQHGGRIDDYRALTIDVTPTILDVVGAHPTPEIDGHSLIDGKRPARLSTTTYGPVSSVTWGVSGKEKLETAARISRLFPSGDLYTLVPEGERDWLSASIDQLPENPDDFGWRLEEPALFDDVKPTADMAPALIRGYLENAQMGSLVAVTVNGTVEAVTRSFTNRYGQQQFDAIVDPLVFRPGRNSIGVVRLS